MDHELISDETPTRELPDMHVVQAQSEEAKGGSISLNYTKIQLRDVGMGAAN